MNTFERGPRRRGRYPLLPDDPYLGWTPYAWLLYLAFFFIEPAVHLVRGSGSAAYWIATAAGTAAFLYTYFRIHWSSGRELVLLVTAQLALGVAFAPLNTGASVFMVYSACFAGQIPDARTAWRFLVVIPTIGAATAWATGAPPHFWLAAVLFAPLFGAVLLHFARCAPAPPRWQDARSPPARDMHDVLGHTLSLVVLKAELARKLIAREPARAQAEIRDVEDVARRALHDVRATIRGYRATLPAEIEHARAILAAAGIRCEVAAPPVAVARAVEEALALALREAATNVVRHAGARACRIALDCDDRTCTLRVEDDGVGVRAPEGEGLRGMRERVEALRGAVERAPAREDGTGTRLCIRLPLDADSPPLGAAPPAPRASADRADCHAPGHAPDAGVDDAQRRTPPPLRALR